jgi:ABC-type sulfate/molybdate transport systems ATPase subunit
VLIQQACFNWSAKSLSGAFSLGNAEAPLDLCLQRGTLVGVLSRKAAGRTSLLQAVAGLMPAGQGRVEVRGTVSMCMQYPQLLAGSVRENVLFGLSFDKHMYQRALECSTLSSVLSLMPNGDMTVVGPGKEAAPLTRSERYIVALARAIYADGDIYVLDGMFEALGTELGMEVWRLCVLGQLRSKTVLVSGPLPAEAMLQCNSLCVLTSEQAQSGAFASLAAGTPPQLVRQGVSLVSLATQSQAARSTEVSASSRAHPWTCPVLSSGEQRALLSLAPPPAWGLPAYLRSMSACGLLFALLLALISQAALTASNCWLLTLAQSPYSEAFPPGLPNAARMLTNDTRIVVLWLLVVGGMLICAVGGSVLYRFALLPAITRIHSNLLSAVIRGNPLQVRVSMSVLV